MQKHSQNTQINATSRYQDSLPVSSDMIMSQLTSWNIPYQCFDHVALRTVEDSKKVQSLFLSSDQGGGHIKNLYLRDNKKQNILLVVEQDRKIDLKSLPTLIGTGRLYFGYADRLLENLGVRPGAVTPLAMITGVKQGVKLFIDSDLKKCLKLYMHPLVNDRTLEMGLAGLQVFFKKVQVAPIWLDLKS
jgi:Ala-tRNA(Pro) deacylase